MKKRCCTCGEIKPMGQFHKAKGSQDGHQQRCKECHKIYQRSEKGKGISRRARRRHAQSEKGKQTQKRYNQPERGKQIHKHYDQSAKGKENQKRYSQSRKGIETGRKNVIIRRTRKTQAGGSYTTDEWHNLCKFYNFHCLKCNKQFPFGKLTVDHIEPVSKGGSSFIWNTQPLCGKCNRSKGNKEIDYRKTLPDWINRGGPVWTQDSLF